MRQFSRLPKIAPINTDLFAFSVAGTLLANSDLMMCLPLALAVAVAGAALDNDKPPVADTALGDDTLGEARLALEPETPIAVS
jgi:hypothetical protein